MLLTCWCLKSEWNTRNLEPGDVISLNQWKLSNNDVKVIPRAGQIKQSLGKYWPLQQSSCLRDIGQWHGQLFSCFVTFYIYRWSYCSINWLWQLTNCLSRMYILHLGQYIYIYIESVSSCTWLPVEQLKSMNSTLNYKCFNVWGAVAIHIQTYMDMGILLMALPLLSVYCLFYYHGVWLDLILGAM